MKKIVSCFALVTFILFFTACQKENHSIRFENDFNLTMENVTAGTAHLGTIAPGSKSAYVPINTGNFTVSGTGSNGGTLSGKGSVTGKGTHKWTIILSSSGQLSIVEDKKK